MSACKQRSVINDIKPSFELKLTVKSDSLCKISLERILSLQILLLLRPLKLIPPYERLPLLRLDPLGHQSLEIAHRLIKKLIPEIKLLQPLSLLLLALLVEAVRLSLIPFPELVSGPLLQAWRRRLGS